MAQVCEQYGERIDGGLRRIAGDPVPDEQSRSAVKVVMERRVQALVERHRAVNDEFESVLCAVVHALRSPAWAIEGLLRPLAGDGAGADDGGACQDIHSALQAADQLTSMVNDLAYLAKVSRHPLAPGPVDLTAAAASVAADLRRTEHETGPHTTFVIADELHTRGDPTLLRIALERLLRNAWASTRSAAQPVIEFSAEFGGTGMTRAFCEPVYCIRDNGAGFDPEYAHDLFCPFRRLRPGGDSADGGMGLAVVRRVIHRHGGRIWAEGHAGRGASFFFTFNHQLTQ
jgi:signal transduction histidine kinase